MFSEIYFGSLPAISTTPSGTAHVYRNDEVMRFLRVHGYNQRQYNDALRAYLRNFFGVTTHTLNDLLYRYIRLHGKFLTSI